MDVCGDGRSYEICLCLSGETVTMANATDTNLPKFKCACHPRFSCNHDSDFCLTDTTVSDFCLTETTVSDFCLTDTTVSDFHLTYTIVSDFCHTDTTVSDFFITDTSISQTLH